MRCRTRSRRSSRARCRNGNGGRRKLKVVTTLHGTDITIVGQDRSYLPITRWGIEKSDAVTAVSSYLRDVTVREFGVQRKIEVVPNFVDAQQYRPDGASPFAQALARDGEALIVHVSNFRPVKRVGDVLAVFDRIRREVPGAAAAHRGRARPLARGTARARGRLRGPHDLPRQRGRRRDDPARDAPDAAALGRRVVRPRGARGDGLRRARHRHRGRRTARGRRGRKARLPAPGRRRGRHGGSGARDCSATTRAGSASRRRAGCAPSASFRRRRSSPATARSTRRRSRSDRGRRRAARAGPPGPRRGAREGLALLRIRRAGRVGAGGGRGSWSGCGGSTTTRRTSRSPGSSARATARRRAPPTPASRRAPPGKPILGALESAALTDAVAAVVRYYGGTKLGTGGLVRAYRLAAERAIAAAGFEVVYDTVTLEVRCPYENRASCGACSIPRTCAWPRSGSTRSRCSRSRSADRASRR